MNKEELKWTLRTYPLRVWLSGASPEVGQRWEGDEADEDGQRLRLDTAECQWWPEAAKAAEQAEFDRLDAEYEVAKAEAGL